MSLLRRDLTRLCAAVLATCTGLGACGDGKSGGPGKPDASDSSFDASRTDAGPVLDDASVGDPATGDSGPRDAGAGDAGTGDAGTTGAGTSDASTIDAGTTDSLSPAYVEGTRLRAQWWQFEDSEPLFAGWYDTKLEAACSFERADGGGYRCLPIAIRGLLYDTDSSECSRPDGALGVFYYPSLPVPGQLMAVTDDFRFSTCGEREYFDAIFRLGEPIDNAGCDRWSGDLFQPGERLAMSEFVGATLQVARVGDRLGVMMYVAEDGTRSPKALYDTKAKHECSRMLPDSNGVYRCMPNPLAFATPTFRDAACTQDDLGVVLDHEDCPGPALAAVPTLNPQNCANSYRFFEGGAAFTEPGYEDRGVGGCVPNSSPPYYPHYVRGAEVAANSLAGAKLVSRGNGRLRPLAFETASGIPLMPMFELLENQDFRAAGFFLDTTLSVSCRPHATAEGTTRCIPSVAHDGAYPEDIAHQVIDASNSPWRGWGDTTCTSSPLVDRYRSECSLPYLVTRPEHRSQPVDHIYQLEPAESRVPNHLTLDMECVTGDEPGLFQRARELPFSTFAEVVHQP